MRDERVRTFVTRSHRRVIEHCDALLAGPLTEGERSRLVAVREAAETEYARWAGDRQDAAR
jgi:hypothetical protein